MGAEAYATGDHIAFSKAPSLHTAAHEAAHVVQQQGGVSLSGGVGRAGDAHEQHADRVADAVVSGQSAEGLLSEYGGGGGGGQVTQRLVQKEGDEKAPEKEPEKEPEKAKEEDKGPKFTAAEFTDKDKLEALEKAMKEALAIAKKALSNIAKGNATYLELMDASATNDATDAAITDRIAHVKTGYEKIQKCLEEDTVIFKKWDLPSTSKFKYDKTYAYVRSGEAENNMYLGGVFWVAKTSGIDSKAGTIVHELSHRLHGTKDHHYGLAKSKQSAKDTPEKATTNADNYEHLAESS